jgi:hypothetical protein
MRAWPRWSGMFLVAALTVLAGCRGCGCGGAEPAKDAGREARPPVAAKQPAAEPARPPEATQPEAASAEDPIKNEIKAENRPIKPGTVGIPPVSDQELQDPRLNQAMPHQSKTALKALEKVQAAHPEIVPQPDPNAPPPPRPPVNGPY